MAAKFWVGGTGNLDGVDTTHISDTSGGSGGATYPAAGDTLTFDGSSGGGTVTFTAAVTLSQIVSGAHTGTIDANGQTIALSVGWTGSGTGTRTVTLGASAITVGNTWNFQIATNLTFNANTSTITVTGLSANEFRGGGLTYATVVIGVSGAGFLREANTFGTLTLTGGVSGPPGLSLRSDQIVTGTFTVNGLNDAVSRLRLSSDIKGTPRTITAATVVVTNADFQDITGAGAGSWDLSAITGGSGDAGGNSNITFTPGATQYWYTATTGAKTWSTAGNWYLGSGGTGGAGRVPLPQDTARFDASSIGATSTTITQDMPRIPATDWTGVTNTPTWTTSTTASFFGSITLVSGMTLTGSTPTYTYEGRGSSVLTSAGKSWSRTFTIHCVGGSLTLGDALTSTTTQILTSGTFSDGGFNVTIGSWADVGTTARSLVMGSGVWTITAEGTSMWVMSASNMTFVPGTATIRMTAALTTARTFAGGGLTYYNFENATTGAFALQITGSNTFNNIHIDASAAARTVLFTAGTTTTVASMTRDAGTNIITIDSITAANHNLVKSGGGNIPSLHHMSISRSQATPGASTWYAGFGSSDGGNNSGWIFGTIPNQSTTATVASNLYVAKSGTTSSIFRTSATAARFTFSALSGLTSSAITVPATVASFLFNGASATAKGIATVAATVASFIYSAMAGVTSVVNPDPRVINVTVSVSPNPAIVVSRSSYSITVSR